MVLDASIDDLASKGSLARSDEHLSRRSGRGKGLLENPGEAVAPIRPLGAAHALLQGLPDRVLVNHELGVTSANVLGNPDPAVTDTEHDPAQPIGLPAAGRYNAAGVTGAVLHCVLAKLADRHQHRVPDNGDIIEMIDQRLQQPVRKRIDLGQLTQAGRSDDYSGVILDKRLVNTANVLAQTKGAKALARRFILGLLDFDVTPSLPMPLYPECKPHDAKRMQAHQVADVQNHLIRAFEVSIKLRGVTVVT